MARNIKSSSNKKCRVPVIIQLEYLECGAACLDMILAYYGLGLSLEQVREDCGVSRDGLNAANIVKAARKYGLDATGYSVELEDLYDGMSFPCIVHWNMDHFVVLRGIDKKYAYINDPAKGERKISIREFSKHFTGVVLTFSPNENFKASDTKEQKFSYLRGRNIGIKAAIIFTVITTAIAYIIRLFEPGFTRVFYDRLLNGNDIAWFYPFMAILVAFYLLKIIINWIQTVYSLKINGKIAITGSSSFMWKLLNLPMQFYSQRLVGDILSRESSNSAIATTIVNTFGPLVFQLASLIFYFIIMIRYSWKLTVVSIVSLLCDAIVSRIVAEKRKNLVHVSTNMAAQKESTAVSGLSMIETIKSSGAEYGFFRKWAGYQAAEFDTQAQSEGLTVSLGLIPKIVSVIASTVTMGIGIYLTIQGEFTLGMITAFQSYLNGFLDPARTFISTGQILEETKVQAMRIDDVMKYPNMQSFKEEGAQLTDGDYEKFSGDIEIRNLSFGYAKLADPLIEDFSLHIKQGSKIALVGSTGCGKSTIAKLISGLYAPWSGEILFDGKRMSEIDKSVFTGSVAVVDQDITIFADTIRNNIKMWDNSIEDFEMILACKDAQILDDINAREGGFNYVLSEGGKEFSGGQRQRLEIARVLAQDPTIVILDEATSSLDAETEHQVVQSINDRGITCIVIAHRLSTIRDCDQILVLDHGKVVEQGSHEELLKQNSYYTRLVTND